MSEPVVIGLGNVLAGDDGAGPAVAAAFQDRPGLRVMVAHQVLPEMAADVAGACLVVFADAARGGQAARVERVAPGADWPPLGHALRPADVVAMARWLYGRCPPAFLVTVPGTRFGPGDRLSASAAAALPEAIRLVEGLLAGDHSVLPLTPGRAGRARRPRRTATGG